jgi:hypothetical protein
VQKKQSLRGLFPQCGVVAPEALEGAVVNVGQTKKATGQVTDRHGEGAFLAICLLLPLRFENQRWQVSAGTSFLLRCDGHPPTFVDDIGLDLKEIGLD